MKIQAHNNELRPLVKHSYEKVYDQLSKLLSPDEFIFAKWEAGFGDVLQWTLPADKEWINLTKADNYDRNAVINEFLRLKQNGAAKLGRNSQLIESVYTVPSEAFVYYTVDPDGRYRLILTGWGYSVPRLAGGGDWTAPDPTAQPVYVRFVENSKPMSALRFDIPRPGGFTVHLTADNNGEMFLGALRPGENMSIIIPSPANELTLSVVKGKQYYTFDLTQDPIQIPEVIPPTEETPSDPTPDEVAVDEEIFVGRNRDISIRFINADGTPVTATEARFSQSGRNNITERLDNDGYVWLDNNDFIHGSPMTIDLHGPQEYDPIPFMLDQGETQYEVVFRTIRKSNIWVAILLIFGAGVAAIGAWFLFVALINLIL